MPAEDHAVCSSLPREYADRAPEEEDRKRMAKSAHRQP
jgi:hypothetical protein